MFQLETGCGVEGCKAHRHSLCRCARALLPECAAGVAVCAGSGEPNFDTFVANPFQTTKQRQTQEVVQLLDKLQPDTIVLDPDTVGRCGGLGYFRLAGPELAIAERA